jgi:hypothetical protein
MKEGKFMVGGNECIQTVDVPAVSYTLLRFGEDRKALYRLDRCIFMTGIVDAF